jgi:hypothetical protein
LNLLPNLFFQPHLNDGGDGGDGVTGFEKYIYHDFLTSMIASISSLLGRKIQPAAKVQLLKCAVFWLAGCWLAAGWLLPAADPDPGFQA